MAAQIEKERKSNKALNVTVLYTNDCPSTPKAIETIRECISELGIQAELQTILITSQEQADRARFLGSPTIHINGNDIDPTIREAKVFGFM